MKRKPFLRRRNTFVGRLALSAELLDHLLDGQDPATVLRSDGLIGELKKALGERILNAEMDVYLDSEAEQAAGNHRNGSSQKTVLSDDGELVLATPRDRHGRFDPTLIRKCQRRFPGARGKSTRDIQAQVGELYVTGHSGASFPAYPAVAQTGGMGEAVLERCRGRRHAAPGSAAAAKAVRVSAVVDDLKGFPGAITAVSRSREAA